MILLSFAFAAAWTVTSAMAAHLPRIVEAFGATPAQAVFGMMIGPAQVAARVLEASTLSRFHPLFSTRLACITHPIGACVIGVFGGGAAAAFALLHGAGNGILTIARGTLPLAIFGPENYAYRLGLIGAPSRIAQALAPLGLLIEPLGRGVVAVSSCLSLAASRPWPSERCTRRPSGATSSPSRRMPGGFSTKWQCPKSVPSRGCRPPSRCSSADHRRRDLR